MKSKRPTPLASVAGALGAAVLLSAGLAPLRAFAVTRPSYNTGSGFFILNGQIYDPSGKAFRIRGMDRTHFDSGGYPTSGEQPGISNTHANTIRMFMYNIGVSGAQPASTYAQIVQDQYVANGEMGIVTAANVAGTTSGTSGDTSTTDLAATVAWWVANESAFAPVMNDMAINIANEWGPANSATWASAYETAISQLRAAGYTCPFVIDSGGSGQDDADLQNYSSAVFNSDPQKNSIFSLHMYGGSNDYSASIQGITKGNSTVITLNSNSACHPFQPSYCGTGNTYSGISAYQVSGTQGMTQLNGEQPAPTNIGGSPGAWTVTLSVNSTGWGTYTGGGTLVDYNGNYALQIGRLAALSQTTGAAYIVGEFGPGRDIGPSPTMMTPAEVISASEANDVGWMAWSFDDNDLSSSEADNEWFSLTYHAGVYTGQSAQLTIFGQQIIEGCTNPAPGGCGCPDNPAPAMTAVEPGCTGTPAPQYSGYGLNVLAQPFSTSSGLSVLTSIVLSPSTATVSSGGTRQFTATAKDQNGDEMSGVNFTFSSTNTAVAAINAAGLATGVAAGAAGIRASSGAVTSNMAVLTVVIPSTVTVTAPPAESRITGTVQLSAQVSSTEGINYVVFGVDGATVATVVSAPYTFSWYSGYAASGTHLITATAVDAFGLESVSPAVSVTVSNPNATSVLNGVYVYPNPALPGQTPTVRVEMGIVDTVKVTIFDVSGRTVYSASSSGAPTGTFNGNYYYDVPWPGAKASGVYFAAIQGSIGGTIVRGRTKFAVVQ